MKKDITSRTSPFGTWLKREIVRAGLNQDKFAEKVDATPTTVSRWIHGRRPNGKYIERIADVLLLDYDLVATKAGYRPRELMETDPESPEGELLAMIRRIRWDESRLAGAKGMLSGYLQADEMERRRRKTSS